MKNQLRNFTLRGAAKGKSRLETYMGREHLVVPVVALVEGVLQPINAPTPELALAEEFAFGTEGWNGRPIFIDHPAVSGVQISGNTPERLQNDAVGIIFNTISQQEAFDTKRLTLEAWIDTAKASTNAEGALILQRIHDYEGGKNPDPVEVSVGVLVATEEKSGTYKGKKYESIWRRIIPDHLALIRIGSEGACNADMGCGIRALAVNVLTNEGVDIVETEEADVKGLKERLLGMIQSIVRTSEEGQSDSDLRRLLNDALRGTTTDFFDIDGVYPDGTEDLKEPHLVYAVLQGNDFKSFRRQYTNADGKVTLSPDVQEVQSRRVYEVVKAAAASATTTGAATSETRPPSCGCRQESNMNRQERIAALVAKNTTLVAKDLETVPDAVLTALEAQAAAPTSPNQNPNPGTVTPPPTTPATTPATVPATTPPPTTPATTPTPGAEAREAAAPKPPTFSELLAQASPEDQDAFATLKANAAATKNAAIAAIKANAKNKFTDAQLAAKPLSELQQMIELMGGSITQPIDYSAVGLPRAAANANTGVPPPPDMVASIRAAAGIKPKEKETVQ